MASHAQYKARRAAGLCGNCGAKPRNGALCDACREYYNQHARAYYKRYLLDTRKPPQRCSGCGEHVHGHDVRTCPRTRRDTAA